MKEATDKNTLLVADDAEYTKQTVTKVMEGDYEIIYASDGLEVLEQVKKHTNVDCIIMGMHMPRLDGLLATQRLKADFTTYHIPIIILTSHIEIEKMVRAVEMGADDYMKKPIIPEELKARITMNIRRAQRDQNSNPLTKLPGNNIINKTIIQRLYQPIAVLYADLDNFKAYNDKYGFNRGDDIIKYTATVLAAAVKQNGNATDFVGHIGGDDFIVISTPERADQIAQIICQQFDQHASLFYNEEDRHAKKIIAQDRKGNICQYPLASISVAIITNEKKELTSMPQIAQLAAELKKYAKSKPSGKLGSNYVKDRRSN